MSRGVGSGRHGEKRGRVGRNARKTRQNALRVSGTHVKTRKTRKTRDCKQVKPPSAITEEGRIESRDVVPWT